MIKQPSFKQDLTLVARGMMMGGADIIPGVSGGTVALIVGIYNRLVTAISHFDVTLINHVRKMEWAAAARHIDAEVFSGVWRENCTEAIRAHAADAAEAEGRRGACEWGSFWELYRSCRRPAAVPPGSKVWEPTL